MKFDYDEVRRRVQGGRPLRQHRFTDNTRRQGRAKRTGSWHQFWVRFTTLWILSLSCFHWVEPGPSFFSSSTRRYPVLLGFYRVFLALLLARPGIVELYHGIWNDTQFYWAPQLSGAIYRFLPSFTAFYKVLRLVIEFYRVICLCLHPTCSQFPFVLSCWNGFYWVLLGFTWVY